MSRYFILHQTDQVRINYRRTAADCSLSSHFIVRNLFQDRHTQKLYLSSE